MATIEQQQQQFSPYDCLMNKCNHDGGEPRCGVALFDRVVKMTGDPRLLLDSQLAAELFSLATEPKLMPDVTSELIRDGHLVIGFTSHKPREQPVELGIRLKIFECYLCSMGYRTADVKDTDTVPRHSIVVSDDPNVDYGLGPGYAIARRAEWLSSSDVKARDDNTTCAKTSILAGLGMAYFGCCALAIELFSTMMTEHRSRYPAFSTDIGVVKACAAYVWDEKTSPLIGPIFIQFRDILTKNIPQVCNCPITEKSPTCKCGITMTRLELYKNVPGANASEQIYAFILCSATLFTKRCGCAVRFQLAPTIKSSLQV